MTASRPAGSSFVPALDPVVAQEQAEALHDEIGRLPSALRLPVVLCYFEGLTIEEAARRLRWPHGTVRSRLARARDKLRRGLERRGVVLPAFALAATLTARPISAAISSQLCDKTSSVATQFSAGRAAASASSVFATTLAREVLKSMLLAQRNLLVIGCLFLGAIAAGSGFVGPAVGRQAGKPDLQERQAGKPDLRHGMAKADDAALKPGPGRMFVVGRVLTPTGMPVPNATVMVYASVRWAGRGDGLTEMSPSAVGQAASDSSGLFRLDAIRTTSSRHYEVGAVAIAPGYGAGWVELDPDAGQPAGDITLRPEQVIQGRLFDVQGRPAQGVEVSVESMQTVVAGSPDMTVNDTVGPYFFWVKPGDLPAWPNPARSDADGRFTIRGAGRNIRVGLALDHPKFARQRTHVDTDQFSDTKNVTMAVEPARIITGRVTYADSGKPALHAVVDISIQGDDGSSFWAGDFITDADGRFRANPGSAHRYLLSSFPPEREPYLNIGKKLDWPRGAIEHSQDLVLPRGILVRGRVTEEGSGNPIAGARIGYISNPDRDQDTGAWNTCAASAADGSFQLGVMPAPGYLTVLGPGEDYVLHEIGQRMALAGKPGGRRIYAHAFHKLDLKPGSASQNVAIPLRPSTAVKGRVVGPDGQPVRNALAISRVSLQPGWVAWLFWTAAYHDSVRDGYFAVHGLASDTEVPVYFLDAEHGLGATAFLSGRSAADGPVTVRLQPCGAAKARLVDPAGKPVSQSRDNYGSHMTMMAVSPGPHRLSQEKTSADHPAADQDFVARFDPIHYRKGLVSDDKGQLSLPALIPGAVYRNYDSTKGDDAGPQLRKEFTVKPGEVLELGDILIEKPKP